MIVFSAAATTFAEPVENSAVDSDFFHPAASHYIHGDAQAASNLVVQGLHQFPNDAKLLRLKELLEQQQQDEQNQDDQQQDDSQEQDDQQQNDDRKQDENQPQDSNQQQNEDQQPQDRDQQQSDEQQSPPQAEEMTQDEAEQLLDAMKQEEENKRLQLHPIMGAPVKVDKDW